MEPKLKEPKGKDGRTSAKQGVVIIASVIHHDSSWSKMKLGHDFHISEFSFGDDRKGGKIAFV